MVEPKTPLSALNNSREKQELELEYARHVEELVRCLDNMAKLSKQLEKMLGGNKQEAYETKAWDLD